ncbi:hypothetical protein [Ralstonia pseudosolanacearum]|uniref:hypothetical protein n=1 Tax=Ralstonia pseudosolanacearum TaxID=1310165 RepID=UPI0026761A5E|nr:hypothetical protein [Ralstonia pseudosolanacearum]MDO3562712.1 hypothetical protein [Ralstonia pseudosolanacearum]MDO3572381.1 hypothetical protein [Ralstonia pseudosolanacearum]
MLDRASNDKKERERFFFEHTQALLPELWPMGRTDTSGENPDIVVQTHRGSYGVEVTELMDETVKAREQRQRRICSLAHGKLGDSRLKQGLGVMVAFKEGVDLSGKPNRNRAVEELVGIVENAIPQALDGVWKRRVECQGNHQSEFFRDVWLHYHPALARSIWQPVTAWWVPVLQADTVARRIEEKEGRVSAYLQRADHVFLLLVVYGFDGSSAAQVCDSALSAEYRTAFSGVVLLEYAENRVHCLRTVCSQISDQGWTGTPRPKV